MAIQVRRGRKLNFDPHKMLPGEWAVSTDVETQNQIIWMCFAAGVVKRMGTYEDFKQQIEEATDDIRQKYEQTFNEIKVYMEGLKNTTEGYKNTASEKAAQATQAATTATQKAAAAAASEVTATQKAAEAARSASSAQASKEAAEASKTAAAVSEAIATEKATESSNSAASAAASATTATEKAEAAAGSAQSADSSKNSAESSKNAAEASAAAASASADAAEDFATAAESFAHGGTGTRQGEDTDNAEFYYDQVRSIADDLGKVLLPKGTVAFASLPALSVAKTGDMYNISDQFTTTADFREGAGKVIAAGSNVYKTDDGKWDVLAGTPVAGVKGSEETEYHTGLVSISAQDTGALPLTGDKMQGNIVLPKTNHIIQEVDNTSNYVIPIEWYKGGVKPNTVYAPHIGYHSTGGDGTGAIAIIPHRTTLNPWEKNVGLYLNNSEIKFNGKNIITESGGEVTGLLTPSGGILYAGKDNYIAYPSDGSFTTDQNTYTGHITITLPVSWTSTMLKFTVSIFDYETYESTDYIVSGYNYSVNSSWYNCSAICIGKYGASHSNLAVRFGHNGTKCVVLIGENSTVWNFPQIKVHDIHVGYGDWIYSTWKSGWLVTIDQTNPTVTQTIMNTHVANGVPAETASNLIYFKNTSNVDVGIDNYDANAIGYVKVSGVLGQNDGALYRQVYSSSWIHEIYGDYRTGQIAVRGKNNGTWQSWRTILDSSNFSNYAPTKTGTGASGTWGISITGNAATATTATNSDKLDGYHGSEAQAASTYVLRSRSGYTFHNYINSNTANNENPSISQVIVTNGSDNYYRKASLAHLKSQMGLNNVNNTADANKTVAAANYLNYQSNDEINFKGNQTSPYVYFNYRNANTGSSSGNTAITTYKFCNRNGSSSGVALVADTFDGNSTGVLSYGQLQIKCTGSNIVLYTNYQVSITDINATTYKPIYASSFVEQSTKSSKENFSSITDEEALNLLKIPPQHFDYINGEKNQSGFIAEDVEEFFPEICSYQTDSDTGEKKLFGLDYSKFSPYIVKLLQVLHGKVSALEQENINLSDRVKRLEKGTVQELSQ